LEEFLIINLTAKRLFGNSVIILEMEKVLVKEQK